MQFEITNETTGQSIIIGSDKNFGELMEYLDSIEVRDNIAQKAKIESDLKRKALMLKFVERHKETHNN